MIEIRDLTKTYQKRIHALQGINLHIGSGMFGLVGPNGAGKTTLMRIIGGLLNPTSGSVHVFGNDMATQAGKHKTKLVLGYLPQNLGLYPNLTGREFLDYVAIIKDIGGRRKRQSHVDELLDLVRLTDVAGRRLKTYSGGMRRRIGIAQALLGDPKLLIVDEPTAGLDPEERVRFRNLLSAMASRCTIILSTHIIEDISHSCTDLAVINHGTVLFRGAPSDLIAQAQGHVWNISTSGDMPNHDLITVSTLQLQNGVQYRVLGTPDVSYNPTPADPTMEDGYIWLMRQTQSSLATSV